ncbi:MAG: hypothetical protein LBL83_08800 [Clostridiales bacterium]|nr:hypothetical protein [Clostridiales bacterium]
MDGAFIEGAPESAAIAGAIRLKALRNAVQLADLVQHFAAAPVRGKLDAIIDAAYGRKGNEDWFTRKPPFVGTPPRYWRFDDSMGEHCLPQLYMGKPCSLAQDLAARIYGALGERHKKEEPTVAFRYQ